MRRSPGTSRVHTGREKLYMLSLISGVQPHYVNYSLEKISS